MKKKLFLVLCSCFAGALALSSCGGGGGGNENLSDLLRPFVNGNFVIDYDGKAAVTVTGQSQYSSATVEANQVAVYGVSIRYCKTGTTGSSESGFANYTIIFDADGVPQRMQAYFYGLTEAETENLLPFEEATTVSMVPDVLASGFVPGTSGQATAGDATVPYLIRRP